MSMKVEIYFLKIVQLFDKITYWSGVVMQKNYCPNLKKMPLSVIFDALSDPARIEIILIILQQQEITCGQCKSPLSKSTMSHHFRVLQEAGIIQRREEGKTHYLSVRTGELEERLPGIISILKKVKRPL